MFPSSIFPLHPFILLLLPLITHAWTPRSPPPDVTLSTFSGTSKIRGVNLGSQFIIEPWMARDEWAAMGCGSTKAEFQCIKQAYAGNVAKASAVWQGHWARWITNADLDDMVKAGLNTVRYSDKAYFYQSDYQSGRAYKFLSWLTTAIHQQPAYFRTVGALGVLNEPKFNNPTDADIRWTLEHYYGSAIDAIRNAEAALAVPASAALSVMMMDDLWHDLSGKTDPTKALTAAQKAGLLFDDHNYETVPAKGMTPAQVVAYACRDDRRTGLQGAERKVVGEWAMSLAQTGAGFTPETANKDFWSQYFSAQQWQYERTSGWVWWSWKVQKGGNAGEQLQWSYKDAPRMLGTLGFLGLAVWAIIDPSDIDSSVQPIRTPKSDGTLQRDARNASKESTVKDPVLETDGRQSFFPVSHLLYNTTLNEYLQDQLNGWRIIAWSFNYWTSWYEDWTTQDESRAGSSHYLYEMQTDLDSYAQQAFPCNASSPTYGSDFMSAVNSTLGLNGTSEAPQDPAKVTSELRRMLAESLKSAKDRAAVLRNLVAASYMGVGFDGAWSCRAAVNEYLENASEWDKAGASAAGTLLTLLPSLLTLGNLYVPKFSEAAAAGVFVSGASAVSTLGLPVKSRFETKSFTSYGRESMARLGRRMNAMPHQARYKVKMKTLQAWYAEPSLSWSEDAMDGYMETVPSRDCTREGEACENMFWKIKSRVVDDWPEREPFAPLMDSSTVLVSYFVTFLGTLLFSAAGIPMQLGSCNSRNYTIWLICGTALSSLAKLYGFARSGHQIFKFYPLSSLAQSTLAANLTLPHDDAGSSNNTTATPPTPTTLETSLPALSRPIEHLLHYLSLSSLQRLAFTSGTRTSQSHNSGGGGGRPLYSTWSLSFRTRHSTPPVPRLRPLTVLLRATSDSDGGGDRSPAHHVLSGLFAGLVFIVLTFLFGAQWGGNLVVVFYTVVAFLLVVAVARGLCVWLVWRLSRKAGLHVVECATAATRKKGGGAEGVEGDEMAGVAR
ncbi:putative endo-beta [Diplodia seriata]|uniref:Putative endo-beta n=1 Tax=Diplodia seriata TaxID=420778 RepID=A0A0G2G231_9PEZI|nr:putative endo-beta [Diplodia seriata]